MRRVISFFIFVWVCSAVQASGQVIITPNVEVNLTSGPSPLAVSFNATGTRHSNSSINTNRFHELLYLWDYDDPTSGVWAPTGKSRNHMSGPLGAHVYEPNSFPDTCDGRACKIFRPSLKVTDKSRNVGTWGGKIEIKVYDPNSMGANGWGDANETVCISKVGNFRDCPLASPPAQHVTSSATVQSLLTTYVAAGRRILFHAGETWTHSAQYNLSAAGPGLIGSYGSGNAKVNFNLGPRTQAFNVTGNKWRIQDLDLSGTMACPVKPQPAAVLLSSSAQVQNLLVQRTTVASGMCSGVVLSMQPQPSNPDSYIHRHVFIHDNEWRDLLSPNGGYQVYAAAWGLNILGNVFGKSYFEHNIRVETGEAVLISNNRLGPNSIGKNNIALRDFDLGACAVCQNCTSNSTCKPFCGRPTKYYLVQDNELIVQTGSGIAHGGATCGPTTANSPSYDHIFERNFFRIDPAGLTGTPQAMSAIVCRAGGPLHRFVVRNNILDETGWTWVNGFLGRSGMKVHNNTCYRSDTTGSGQAACVTGAISECYNNVLYAPRWSKAKRWWNPESWNSPCAIASNNFDDGMTRNITRSPFVSTTPSNPTDFTPANGSELIDAGTPISGVFDDHSLHCRIGTPDAGAIEGGAPPLCAPDAGSTETLTQPGKPGLFP